MKQYKLEPGLKYSIKWGKSVRVIVEILETTPRQIKYIFRGLDPKYEAASDYYLVKGEQVYKTFKNKFLAWLRNTKARRYYEAKHEKRRSPERRKDKGEDG